MDSKAIIRMFTPQRNGSNWLLNLMGNNPRIAAPFPPVLVGEFDELALKVDEKTLLSLMIENGNLNSRLPEGFEFHEDMVARHCKTFDPLGIQEGMYRAMTSHEKSGAKIILDKSPCNPSILHDRLKQDSAAKTVVLVRHPCGVAGSAAGTPRCAGSPEKEGMKWVRINVAAKELLTKFPEQVMLVKYENLVEDTRKALTDICNFLGVGYSESMMMAHKCSAAKKASVNPLWKNLDLPPLQARAFAWRAELTQAEIDLIWNNTSHVAEWFGYRIETAIDPDSRPRNWTPDRNFKDPRQKQLDHLKVVKQRFGIAA